MCGPGCRSGRCAYTVCDQGSSHTQGQPGGVWGFTGAPAGAAHRRRQDYFRKKKKVKKKTEQEVK